MICLVIVSLNWRGLDGVGPLDPQLLSLTQPVFTQISSLGVRNDPLSQMWKFSAYKGESTLMFALVKYVKITSFVRVIHDHVHMYWLAFDKMNHHGLFIRLMERKIPANLLSLLELWFSIGITCIKWGNLFSSFFYLKCGTRQGGVLSTYLRRCLLCILTALCSGEATGGFGWVWTHPLFSRVTPEIVANPMRNFLQGGWGIPRFLSSV